MPINAWNIGVVVAGYVISLVGGYFIINPIIVSLWNRYFPDRKHHALLPAEVGILDRFLFMTAYMMGIKEFIVVWLAFKLAGQWTPSQTDVDRLLYYIFLIGNGLSLIISIGIAVLIQALIQH